MTGERTKHLRLEHQPMKHSLRIQDVLEWVQLVKVFVSDSISAISRWYMMVPHLHHSKMAHCFRCKKVIRVQAMFFGPNVPRRISHGLLLSEGRRRSRSTEWEWCRPKFPEAGGVSAAAYLNVQPIEVTRDIKESKTLWVNWYNMLLVVGWVHWSRSR